MSLGIDFHKGDWLAVSQANNTISYSILTTLHVLMSLKGI